MQKTVAEIVVIPAREAAKPETGARPLKVPGATDVNVKPVYAPLIPSAATTLGMTCASPNAQRIAADAAEEREERRSLTDVPLPRNRDVMAASAKTVYATRMHSAASAHGMMSACPCVPTPAEDAGIREAEKAEPPPMDVRRATRLDAAAADVNHAYAQQIHTAATMPGMMCA